MHIDNELVKCDITKIGVSSREKQVAVGPRCETVISNGGSGTLSCEMP